MSIHDYESWELMPAKLSKEERENPIQVVDEFFDFAHLPQAREFLWEWLKATVTGNFCSALSKKERGDIVYFYERLEKLIEAAWLLKTKS